MSIQRVSGRIYKPPFFTGAGRAFKQIQLACYLRLTRRDQVDVYLPRLRAQNHTNVTLFAEEFFPGAFVREAENYTDSPCKGTKEAEIAKYSKQPVVRPRTCVLLLETPSTAVYTQLYLVYIILTGNLCFLPVAQFVNIARDGIGGSGSWLGKLV